MRLLLDSLGTYIGNTVWQPVVYPNSLIMAKSPVAKPGPDSYLPARGYHRGKEVVE
jgi:hypothetical protein